MSDASQVALKILATMGGKTVGELRPDMQLVADLDIDSPKALELLIELEEAFAIEIEDEDAARMETVGDVLSYVGQIG